MSANPTNPSPATGPDILARYLHAYISARKMSDLERPWGLGDDSLDHLWGRLLEALSGDPEEFNKMIAEELSEDDRQHIVERLAPLIFALPMRVYPVEVRAIRSGSYFILSLRNFVSAEPADSEDLESMEDPLMTKLPTKLSSSKKNAKEDALGFLPSALAVPFANHLRQRLGFGDDVQRKEVTISSGGRRRRVRVSILSRNRGVVIRFLERLRSPMDECR